MPESDFLQHHVQTSSSTGTGHALVVNNIHGVFQVDLRKTLFESIVAMPVNGCRTATQEPYSGENIAASFYGAKNEPTTTHMLKPAEQAGTFVALCVPASTYDNRVQIRIVHRYRLGRHLDTGAGRNIVTICRQKLPSIQVATATIIGNTEWFNQRRQAEHTELFQQDECESKLGFAGWSSHYSTRPFDLSVSVSR